MIAVRVLLSMPIRNATAILSFLAIRSLHACSANSYTHTQCFVHNLLKARIENHKKTASKRALGLQRKTIGICACDNKYKDFDQSPTVNFDEFEFVE